MINADKREYNYYLYGVKDSFAQQTLSKEPQGKIKMTINTLTQNTQDNVRYKDATYIGLTNTLINDSYVIEYGEEKLKVLYVNPKGRLKQVYMKLI